MTEVPAELDVHGQPMLDRVGTLGEGAAGDDEASRAGAVRGVPVARPFLAWRV